MLIFLTLEAIYDWGFTDEDNAQDDFVDPKESPHLEEALQHYGLNQGKKPVDRDGHNVCVAHLHSQDIEKDGVEYLVCILESHFTLESTGNRINVSSSAPFSLLTYTLRSKSVPFLPPPGNQRPILVHNQPLRRRPDPLDKLWTPLLRRADRTPCHRYPAPPTLVRHGLPSILKPSPSIQATTT